MKLLVLLPKKSLFVFNEGIHLYYNWQNTYCSDGVIRKGIWNNCLRGPDPPQNKAPGFNRAADGMLFQGPIVGGECRP